MNIKQQLSAADMNGDGEIDLSDAIIIYTSLGVYDGAQVNAKSPSLDLLILAAKGNDFTMSLDNQDAYTGFQCDIRVPEGSSLADISLNPSRGTGHTLMLFLLRLLLGRQFHDEAVQFLWQTLLVVIALLGGYVSMF